jgi:hypothetical protein
MLNNKYQFIDDPRLLPRPRRALVPSGSSLSSFDSKSPTLDQDCNFALEMLKFLPKTEVLGYAGKKTAAPGSPDAKAIQHGHYDANGNGNANGTPQNDWVTKDYYDAFDQYGISAGATDSSGAALTLAAVEGLSTSDDQNYNRDKNIKVSDLDFNHDGKVTNSELLQEYDSLNPSGDGLKDWDTILAAGKHHRSGTFGSFGNDTIGGVAGDGMLAGFSNIDAIQSSSADNWNHIGKSVGNYDMAYDPTVQAALQKNGLSWDDVENLLNTNPLLAGKSYYEIVMDGNYSSLSTRDAFLLTCAMDESRYRAWKGMTDMFGSVNDTRNDQAMIASINKYVKSLNSSVDHHSISLVPFFLYIQHSFTNQVTNYYEHGLEYNNKEYSIGNAEGYNKSYLDITNFSDFSQWLGRSIYDNDKGCDHLDKSYTGQLFEQRGAWTDQNDQVQKDKVYATDALIDEWFGATDPGKANSDKITINIDDNKTDIGAKLAEPVWEGYGDVWESDNWQSIAPLRLDNGKTIVEVNFSQLKGISYGWDRKASNYPIECKDASGEIWWTSWASDANWITVQNAISLSKVNTKNNGYHENYDTAQFQGLTADSATRGPLFNSNWVVHAVGMYYRAGAGQDLLQVMQKSMTRRRVSANYKQDKTDYRDRQDELTAEKAQDERITQMGQARAKAEWRKWLGRASKQAKAKTSNTNSQPSKVASGTNQSNAAAEANKAFNQRSKAQNSGKKRS